MRRRDEEELIIVNSKEENSRHYPIEKLQTVQTLDCNQRLPTRINLDGCTLRSENHKK